jgi:hypothetical protein
MSKIDDLIAAEGAAADAAELPDDVKRGAAQPEPLDDVLHPAQPRGAGGTGSLRRHAGPASPDAPEAPREPSRYHE